MPSHSDSWDDFRVVKAIADCGSLADAAKALGINQSTVFRKLGQIEQRMNARLFRRDRARYAATAQGERVLRLARRIEQEVAAFERAGDDERPEAKSFAIGIVPIETIVARGGLDFLADMVDGKIPQPPMCETLGFHLAEVAEGFAAFEGLPEFRHYNPIGTVHGGFAATLLDSALGCAVFSTMAKGEAWTTLELKLNLVRPINKDTGAVRAEGRIVHRGRSVATAEGTVKDRAGKLFAHATTTCMVFPVKG
jgi:uncharacterized protein (TIGR00369 family)